jgi:putative transposase
MEEDNKGRDLSNVIRIDDDRVREHLGLIVRGTVEETLNAMLEAEADRLINAGRYERSEARRDFRSGKYERKLETKAGPVRLQVPKLRRQTFETAVIERYRRRESSVEEALIEMYLAGVSVRRVEDITEALWGTRVSPGTVSNLNLWTGRALQDENVRADRKRSASIYPACSWASAPGHHGYPRARALVTRQAFSAIEVPRIRVRR